MAFWKRIVRNYFTFNNRERRGVYVLLVLLTLLSAVHLAIRLSPDPSFELTPDQRNKLALFAEIQAKRKKEKEIEQAKPESKPLYFDQIHWFEFDPNIATIEEFMILGLDTFIAFRIENYRSKGGAFYDIDDLSKMYGLDQSWLDAAGEFIVFPEKKTKKSWVNFDTIDQKPKHVIAKIELNTADSSAMVSLPWVGAFYAKEIIKLREGLGGFRTYSELADIYRMSDQAIESIMKHATLDSNLRQRININTCDIKRLGIHPSITWKQAKIIINYRDQHGPYKRIRDIKRTDVISDSLFQKIAPYLTID
jgi:competence protein ComEA